MGDTRHGIAIEVARLQGDISAALSRLEGLPEQNPRYEAAFNDVIAASSTLLAYETEIPAKLQEPHRKASKKVMQWASWAHLGGAGLLALAPLTGWISWWWLVVAAIQAAVGFLVTGLDPKTGDHYNLRFSAGALTLVTILRGHSEPV
ncbi:hypothetical protein GCM10010271_67580 [Streptomyces kurssanovii]|nr:hypothetical protein GCM10010271_67580 [Streptomyces kurssanovii]